MTVPSRPTVILATDGIMGQKTRDAIAWLISADRFTVGTSMPGISQQAPSVMKKWQQYVGYRVQLFADFRDGNGNCTSVSGYTGGSLVIDGQWGSKTRVATAGWILWTGGAVKPQCTGASLSDMGYYGDSVYELQRGLNRFIFGHAQE